MGHSDVILYAQIPEEKVPGPFIKQKMIYSTNSTLVFEVNSTKQLSGLVTHCGVFDHISGDRLAIFKLNGYLNLEYTKILKFAPGEFTMEKALVDPSWID